MELSLIDDSSADGIWCTALTKNLLPKQQCLYRSTSSSRDRCLAYTLGIYFVPGISTFREICFLISWRHVVMEGWYSLL